MRSYTLHSTTFLTGHLVFVNFLKVQQLSLFIDKSFRRFDRNGSKTGLKSATRHFLEKSFKKS